MAHNKPSVVFVNIPPLPIGQIVEAFKNNNRLVVYLGMPMGILYLSAYAKRMEVVGHVSHLDYTRNMLGDDISLFSSVEQFIDYHADKNDFIPDIVAISANFTTSHDFLILAADRLKRKWPKSALIVGGHHATSSVSTLFASENIDFVARGEGEIGFADFCRQIGEGKSPVVKGIYERDSYGHKDRFALDLCEMVDDLDRIPFPDWSIIDMEAYLTAETTRSRRIGEGEMLTPRRVATFSTSRGCPFSCTFCASSIVHGRRMRYRSIDSVMKELKVLREQFKVNIVLPDDDLFTANKERTKTLLLRFHKEMDGVELQTPSGLSVNTLDFEILDLFIATGSKVLTIAVESGSEYVQNHIIKKRCNLSKAKDLVKYLRDRDVIVRCYFIIGFPGETIEQMEETIRFAGDLKCDWAGIAVAIPLPGSEMNRQFMEMGVISGELDAWLTNYIGGRTFDAPGISAVDVNTIARSGNMMVNFFENPNIREKKFQKAIDLYYDVVYAYPFHVVGLYCIAECLDALEKHDEAGEVRRRILDIIRTDDRARGMYLAWKHKLPKIETQ